METTISKMFEAIDKAMDEFIINTTNLKKRISDSILKEEPLEYEILSYGTINDNHQESVFKHQLSDCKKLGCGIRSVKRLSDGEIFTLGDEVELIHGDMKGTITRFYTKDDLVFIYTTWSEVGVSLGGWKKVKASEPRKPLFTTDDGMEIYQSDHTYIVDDKFQMHGPQWYKGGNKNLRSFYDPKNAENYILQNKPRFSVNDVCNIYDSWSASYQKGSFREELVEKSKEKE